MDIKQIIRDHANEVARSRGFIDELQIDAFRHAYVSAVLTRWLGHAYAKKVFDEHERKHPDEDYGETLMDLYNNSVGRGIGLSTPVRLNWRQHIISKVDAAVRNRTLIVELTDSPAQSAYIQSK